ncbi:MAG TPA: hypothetical protein H9857_02910 [Candidatus Desulfovibrio intestinigallinarum]|nr:hypothetical protein [Candidatus Desulfovibrio intestinigallinarum]
MPVVTVVPKDRLIIVDGVALNFVFDAPETMHALQWDGQRGHIEWEDDDNWPLEAEAYNDEVAPYVALWQAEKALRDKAAAEAAEEYNSLASTKARKLAEINAACDAALASLTADYPESELLTFDKQEAEARALLADPEAVTPFLTPLAAARGMETEELARKVIAKADAFTTASGHVIGLRQKDEDRLKAAQSVEDVAVIVPEYRLPEAG